MHPDITGPLKRLADASHARFCRRCVSIHAISGAAVSHITSCDHHNSFVSVLPQISVRLTAAFASRPAEWSTTANHACLISAPVLQTRSNALLSRKPASRNWLCPARFTVASHEPGPAALYSSCAKPQIMAHKGNWRSILILAASSKPYSWSPQGYSCRSRLRQPCQRVCPTPARLCSR